MDKCWRCNFRVFPSTFIYVLRQRMSNELLTPSRPPASIPPTPPRPGSRGRELVCVRGVLSGDGLACGAAREKQALLRPQVTDGRVVDKGSGTCVAGREGGREGGV